MDTARTVYVMYEHGKFSTPLAILDEGDIIRLFEAIGEGAVELKMNQIWPEADEGAGERD